MEEEIKNTVLFNKVFTEKQCRKCGKKVEPVTKNITNKMHGFKLFCPFCDSVVGWGGLNKSIIKNGQREKSSRWNAHRLNIYECQICRRKKEHLGERETLEVHHVLPVQHGGEDVPGNIWVVCTSCHKLIHHQQTYHNDHLYHKNVIWESHRKFKIENPDLYYSIHKKYPVLTIKGE